MPVRAEVALAACFRQAGTEFLAFHSLSLAGSAPEESLHDASTQLAKVVANVAPVLRENAPRLRIGLLSEGYRTSRSHSIPQAFLLLARGIELTGRRMAEIPERIPSIRESASLRPLAPLQGRLVEAGRSFIAISSVLEELDLVLSERPPDQAHLSKLERRLQRQVEDLDEFLLLTREQISIAMVELALTVRSRE